jgi:hypothetical protein
MLGSLHVVGCANETIPCHRVRNERRVVVFSACSVESTYCRHAGDEALTKTIAALDSDVFDAYNRCDLKKFASFFVPNVEFYHDKGGATFDRKSVVANTKKYICNKVRRELIASTLKVYPIRDFGAIEEGEHRFCQRPVAPTTTETCEGVAKFVIIWKHVDTAWTITRVMSYGHRSLADGEK